jgi:hypothetical protein
MRQEEAAAPGPGELRHGAAKARRRAGTRPGPAGASDLVEDLLALGLELLRGQLAPVPLVLQAGNPV